MLTVSDDPIDDLAKRVVATTPPPKRVRKGRQLSLSDPEYEILMRYCRRKGLNASDIVDDLIQIFLRKVKDDLPADDRGKLSNP